MATESDRVFEERERLADVLAGRRTSGPWSPRGLAIENHFRVTDHGMTMEHPLVADLAYTTPEGGRYEITIREIRPPAREVWQRPEPQQRADPSHPSGTVREGSHHYGDGCQPPHEPSAATQVYGPTGCT